VIFHPLQSIQSFKQACVEWTIDTVKPLPLIGGMVKNYMKEERLKVQRSLLAKEFTILAKHPDIQRITRLPEQRLKSDQVLKQLQLMADAQDQSLWKSGKVSGTVYHGLDTNLTQLINQSYQLFSHTNPLHPDVFPLVRKMESEVVAMCLRMFQCALIGGDDGCGNMTSGGTESILMACKSYRDYYKYRTQNPVMIVPVTVHAAFDKACGYFGIELIKVDVDSRGGVDVKQVEKLITSDTVMIVGSAPSYPHGIVDDIEALGRLALRYDVGLHVDCCLGSFILPHMAKAGFTDIPPFDFRVSGVTSISCDTHKFGFAPKGSSVVLYRFAKHRHSQYFVSPDWTGGIYASPTIAGSRPGALVATCWAAMVYMGEPGYIEAAGKIVGAARKIRDFISTNKSVLGRELEVCYQPLTMVVAFRSRPGRNGTPPVNIYTVGDAMTKLGWNLNALQNPAALHICCTMPTTQSVDQFCRDLESAVSSVASQRDTALKSGKKVKDEGNAAIYGMAESIPDKRLIGEITKGYLDGLTAIVDQTP
jgi:sphinganine-1-phosphate aldolase